MELTTRERLEREDVILEADAPVWAVVVLAIANAVLGVALGLLLSAFAATEFQAVQFMPAFLLPQLLLAGPPSLSGRRHGPAGAREPRDLRAGRITESHATAKRTRGA